MSLNENMQTEKSKVESYTEWSAKYPTTYCMSILEVGGYWVRNTQEYYTPIEVAYRKYCKDNNIETHDGNFETFS